jgi:hypothetical protein
VTYVECKNISLNNLCRINRATWMHDTNLRPRINKSIHAPVIINMSANSVMPLLLIGICAIRAPSRKILCNFMISIVNYVSTNYGVYCLRT